MIFKRTLILGALLASLGVSAQMPVPVLDTDTQAKAAAEATAQLEALLLCKKGTTFSAANVESQFRALGLVKGGDGIYLPARRDLKIMLMNNEVLAASVGEPVSYTNMSVYLKGQTGKQLAGKLGVTQIADWTEPDEDYYFKKTSKKTMLLVGFPSSITVVLPKGEHQINYSASVRCQLLK